jgi:hypothetical protein
MVSKRAPLCLELRYRNSAGLHQRPADVQSATTWRMRRPTLERRSSRWSEPNATSHEFALACDRALWRKGAQVQVYHVCLPGQTGMCSPSALCFPELAAGLGVRR